MRSKPRPDLSLLSIEAAEEIERTKQNIETTLKSVKELSSLIKGDFTRFWNYSKIFSNAYFETYNKEIPILPSKTSIAYMREMSKKLDNIPNLKDIELEKLKEFCISLNGYSAAYEEWIESLKGPCF